MDSHASQDAIAAAMSNPRPDDVIAGIKQVVARELETLDPNATILTTDYFNHTFIPDMVVRWSSHNHANERPVYLRFTLRAAVTGEDIPALSSTGPIVLALKPDAEDEASRARVRESMESSPSLLLTDVPALDEALTNRHESPAPPSPLLGLVRQNIVRGARGVLDASTVQALNESASPPVAEESGRSQDPLAAFERIVDAHFVEESAFQLRRSAELLRLGLSENLDSEFVFAETQVNLLKGLLSVAELNALLPYLLSRPDATRSEIFWRQVGSMMSLASLEGMAPQLEGLNLDPLVRPSLDLWTANRAYLTSVAEDDILPVDEVATEELGWHMRSGLLSLAIADWRLFLASDGRRLRGRQDSRSARWADLAQVLDEFQLSRVVLQGAARTVEIGTDGDRDIRSDVAAITASIEDDFFVPVAQVREHNTDDADPIRAEFSTMLAIARGRASIRALARTALRVLGYRYPAPSEDFDRLLGN